jgi:hypothetical protein
MAAYQHSRALNVLVGAVIFKQQLSQIATVYKDAKGGFEPKVSTTRMLPYQLAADTATYGTACMQPALHASLHSL